MSIGVARTAPARSGITVSIARDPALVRTVRLIAAAVARRTGQDEDFVEEVRLAVGEACGLMVGEAAGGDGDADAGPVTISLAIGDRLRVDVTASGPVGAEDPVTSDIDGVEPWALLRGLIEDFSIRREGASTTLTMSWPLG